MEMQNTAIRLENVSVVDSDGTTLLKNLDLELRKDRKAVLMGANGSGKSLLLRCLAGLERPSEGTIFRDDLPYDYSAAGLQLLQRNTAYFLKLSDGTVCSHAVPAGVYGCDSDPSDRPSSAALSDGQKSFQQICRVLQGKPDLLLLDLPGTLDVRNQDRIRKRLEELSAAGTTILAVSHDTDFALRWADNVILLENGEFLIQGAPKDVLVNQRALSAAGLHMPVVLQIFEDLCKKAVLNPGLSLPRTVEELKQDIASVPTASYQRHRDTGSGEKKTAVLVVSFGTSFRETREKTIDQIEAEIGNAFPEAHLYRAWTSKMILRKLERRDGIHIDNVKEAMERMIADGVTDLIVQPTHVINGIENDLMKEDIMGYASELNSISFGTPLLTSVEDNEAAIRAVMDEWHLPEDEVLVFMGHGTTHYANAIYAALDYTFKDMGYSNVFLGTVEAYPSMHSLLRQVHSYHPKKVHLAPFMIVAGDHASNDMSGDDPDSWKCQFEAEGFTVECHMKGLGEYSGIRALLVRHAQEAAHQNS